MKGSVKNSFTTSLFFIALIPDLEFQKEVVRIKEGIREKYGSGNALKSPAHITLHMPFKWRDDRLDRLENYLSDFGNGQLGFSITLKDFGSFPRRVIFIRVIENGNLNKLQRDLLKMAAQKLKLENGAYRDKPFHPHMTVAFRDLKPSKYEKAWEEFKDRKLDYSFSVNSFFLLKHNGKSWDIFREFKF